MPGKPIDVLNSHAAELAVFRLLLCAALRQLPDQRLLFKNFSVMAEDNEVRTMYSDMPETFFEAFRLYRATWEQLLADAIAQTASGSPSDS